METAPAVAQAAEAIVPPQSGCDRRLFDELAPPFCINRDTLTRLRQRICVAFSGGALSQLQHLNKGRPKGTARGQSESVLITGAAGFGRSQLIRALLAMGYRVTGLDVTPPSHAGLLVSERHGIPIVVEGGQQTRDLSFTWDTTRWRPPGKPSA